MSDENVTPLKLTPEAWCLSLNRRILDPDGWRRGARLGEKAWEEPISREEFEARYVECTVGPPPNLLTPDEIRRIHAALDRMEALPEDLVEAPEFDTLYTTPSGKDFHLAYIIGVASLAILAGLWWALR